MMRNQNNWIIGLVALLVGIGLFLGILWVGRVMMQPSQMRADQLPGIAMGGKVSVVGQITALDQQAMTIEMLQGTDYDQRTGTFLYTQRTGKESIVMGSEADVKSGAVAQFDGIKTGPDTLQLDRIVILTGRVKGPPPQ